ncbi:MAG TPA: tRNA (adenosine(37)-N6)-threonylcarbamoyltransferase complex ATPase subunit type 1 TsaE [Oscillospiraceae bacterium]|nr:tRNA (adenosine(37)-N6)-threonylcarbamoyltransferase complex ATPase subunit type 1 TsaE [Oscillospiraceae bacterium]
MEYVINSAHEGETEALGIAVGRLLFPGAVIYLDGDLGAGKTVFARGIGQGLGVTTLVTSPTFTLLNAHQGRLPFYHFDLYRLQDESELFEIGLDECLDGDGVSLVEWANKFAAYLASWPALTITISQDVTDRQLVLQAASKPYRQIVESLMAGR